MSGFVSISVRTRALFSSVISDNFDVLWSSRRLKTNNDIKELINYPELVLWSVVSVIYGLQTTPISTYNYSNLDLKSFILIALSWKWYAFTPQDSAVNTS